MGISYNRLRLTNKFSGTNVENEPDLKENSDFLKIGYGTALNNTHLYLLSGAFKKQQKATNQDFGTFFESGATEEGIIIESELHVPLSEHTTFTTRLGAIRSRIGNEETLIFDRMRFLEDNSGNKTALQAGVGVLYSVNSLELAAETEYVPTWIISESKIDRSESEVFSGAWKFRAGANVFLSKIVNWQIGFNYNFIKTNSAIQEFGSSRSENLILDPVHSSNIFITTGINYNASRHITLGYNFNYNSIPTSFPSEFFDISRIQILTPITNRIVLQYKF